MDDSIVVAGSLAQKPNQGGHTWVLLQYLLGFKRLGFDALFLDQVQTDESAGIRYAVDVLERFGFGGSFALLWDDGEHSIGLPRERVLERTRDAAFLLNVMGFLTDQEILGAARRRVFLDIDPGFGQMWRELGLADVFKLHDDFVTIGENIGQPDCSIPTCGLEWITTLQPIVLEHWPAWPPAEDATFTSVASWRGAYGPLEYGGQTYGLRVHEFRKFAELPRHSGQPFELALDIHPSEVNDLALLHAGGWQLTDPRAVAGDPWAYQDYIRRSKAELMVAKGIYVQANSGWFSDRSICYLASGRPVLAQDTGFSHNYPVGEGLVAFRDLDEALAGVEAISGDYPRHAQAARAIAEEYFDSDRVLGRLLTRLGVA